MFSFIIIFKIVWNILHLLHKILWNILNMIFKKMFALFFLLKSEYPKFWWSLTNIGINSENTFLLKWYYLIDNTAFSKSNKAVHTLGLSLKCCIHKLDVEHSSVMLEGYHRKHGRTKSLCSPGDEWYPSIFHVGSSLPLDRTNSVITALLYLFWTTDPFILGLSSFAWF